jgi:hypothetical protein
MEAEVFGCAGSTVLLPTPDSRLATGSFARVSDLGELFAEFAGGRGDGSCAASTLDVDASTANVNNKLFKFFILSPCKFLDLGELMLEVFDLLAVSRGLDLFLRGRVFDHFRPVQCVLGRAFTARDVEGLPRCDARYDEEDNAGDSDV